MGQKNEGIGKLKDVDKLLDEEAVRKASIAGYTDVLKHARSVAESLFGGRRF